MPAVTPIETPPDDQVRAFYERIEQTSGGLGVLNVFKVMAHTPELMESWWRMMATLFGRLKLDPRLRELAILRLFQLRHIEYGFAHHVRLGKQAGLSDDDIAALDRYDAYDGFSALDRLVLRYTDAVTALAGGEAAIARELRAHLSEQEVVELTFCIANWNLMAHLLVPLEIELEAPARAWLPEEW